MRRVIRISVTALVLAVAAIVAIQFLQFQQTAAQDAAKEATLVQY
jgi:hypothetical protein